MAKRYLDSREDELLPQQRLQPYLLDRLTRDPYDPTLDTSLNAEQFKETLRRDLSFIFSTRSHPDSRRLKTSAPLVASSAMNFGMAPFTGQTAGSMNSQSLVEMIREAITRFEPRIVPSSLQIFIPKTSAVGASIIELVIEGQAVGIAERISFKTSLDLATGVADVKDKNDA